MSSGVSELAIEAVSIALYGALSTALAYGSYLSELTAFDYLGAGDVGLALWFGVMGLVALVAGVSLLREKILPSVLGTAT